MFLHSWNNVISISGHLTINDLLYARKHVLWAKYMAHGIYFAKIVVPMLVIQLRFFTLCNLPCQKRNRGGKLASTTACFQWFYCTSLRAVKNWNDFDEFKYLLSMKLKCFMLSPKTSSCVLILGFFKGLLRPKEQPQCPVHFMSEFTHQKYKEGQVRKEEKSHEKRSGNC